MVYNATISKLKFFHNTLKLSIMINSYPFKCQRIFVIFMQKGRFSIKRFNTRYDEQTVCLMKNEFRYYFFAECYYA